MAADPLDEPVRSAAVWYADGTLVIRAGNTLFRVYRGILASQSDIFNDMLSVPQPLDVADAETFEGCVVVRVHDTPVDMERFLRTILDIRHSSNLSSLNVSHLVSTMRLASKYAADGVLRRGVEHLQVIFPVSPSIHDYDAALLRRFRLSPAEVITLANLVQELQVSKLVASLAFTCALDLSLKTIVEGVTINERNIELSPWMKRNALRVRTGVVGLLDSLLCKWIVVTSSSCTQKDICLTHSRATKTILLSSAWSARANLPPYTADERLTGPSRRLYEGAAYHWLPLCRPGVHVTESFCGPCQRAFREEYTGLRDKIWQSVPGWVGDCQNWGTGDDD